MRAAIEQREAITPELLQVLDTAAENPLEFARRQDYMLHLFAMYLLAQFRETRAYRPLVRIFSAPGETPFDLAGDTVTEALNRILASVYDADPIPLQALVEAPTVNEFVRSAALRTFKVLAASGQMSREAVVKYLRELANGKLPREFAFVWTAVARAIGDLPAPELMDDLRQMFRDGLVEGGPRDLEFIEREVRQGGERDPNRLSLITNAIAEMEWWHAFHKDDEPWHPRRGASPTPARDPSRPNPAVARPAKPGRNDPCPCGSGRKFKKCCGKN
jgi:predicted Zn-dependent protease with MMP-like domain